MERVHESEHSKIQTEWFILQSSSETDLRMLTELIIPTWTSNIEKSFLGPLSHYLVLKVHMADAQVGLLLFIKAGWNNCQLSLAVGAVLRLWNETGLSRIHIGLFFPFAYCVPFPFFIIWLFLPQLLSCIPCTAVAVIFCSLSKQKHCHKNAVHLFSRFSQFPELKC